METRANFALIGAFVLTAIVSVIGFVLWLGASELNRDFAQYDIIFEGPVSLEEGASVRYIGIKVGEVEQVRIDFRDASKVRARIRVDKETPVKSDSSATIEFAGITGVTFVQINAGSDSAGPLTLKPNQDVPVIAAASNPLDQLFSSGNEIAGRASQTLSQASKLFTDENIAALSTTLQNVETITTTLAENDAALLAEAADTLRTLNIAAERLAKASDAATSLAGTVDGQVATLGADMTSLVAELESVTNDIGVVLTESRQSVGSITDLVEGPAAQTLTQSGQAAQELRVLLARLDRVVRDLETNPQSLVVGRPQPYEGR